MKVLIIAFANFDNVISYAKSLGIFGLEVTVAMVLDGNRLVTGTVDIDISDIIPGYYREQSLAEQILSEEYMRFINGYVKLHLIKAPKPKSLKKNLIENYVFFKKIAKQINRTNYDVIHFNGTGLFCYVIAKFIRDKPKVWTLHDYKPHSGEGRLAISFMNRMISKKMDSFVQHYKYLRRRFALHFKVASEKVFQVYSGTFDIYKYYSNSERKLSCPYILWFGRISPYKGLEELIDAYNELCKESNLNIPTLIIAGDGNLWFDKRKIQSNPSIIIYHRRIPTEELISLIKHSEFIVCPYKNATHSAVVMVSYTFNKPVLTTDVCGLSEVVLHNKTGYLAEDCTVQSLKKALEGMFHNTDIEELAKNIESLCTDGDLSWEKIARNYSEIYKKSISSYYNKPNNSAKYRI